jgi:hypothetical protein
MRKLSPIGGLVKGDREGTHADRSPATCRSIVAVQQGPRLFKTRNLSVDCLDYICRVHGRIKGSGSPTRLANPPLLADAIF